MRRHDDACFPADIATGVGIEKARCGAEGESGVMVASVTAGSVLGLVLLLAPSPVSAKDRIGAIDFYGYKGIDLAKVRAELPVHVGDPYSANARARIQQAVVKSIGKGPTEVDGVCCNADGDRLIYIGLPGQSYKPFEYNPAPVGSEKLPLEIGELYDKHNRAVMLAAQKGGDSAQEDDSKGYALTNDSDTRAIELSIRAWGSNVRQT